MASRIFFGDGVKVIGNSLSFCVQDILTGKVKENDVMYIRSSCKEDEQSWPMILNSYQNSYWRGNPEGKAIANRLRDQEKLSFRDSEQRSRPLVDIWVPYQ